MPPLHPGDPGEGSGDDHDPEADVGPGGGNDPEADPGFRPPLPPEDRIWRHPSEVALERARAARVPRARRTAGLMLLSAGAGAAVAVTAMAVLGVDERIVERQVPVQAATVAEGADAPEDQRAAAHAVRSVAAVVARSGGEILGSAIVLRSDGHLVTDAGVVRGARPVQVVLGDAAPVDAEVVGADELTGVAVLRVEVDGLVPVRLGRSGGFAPGMRAVLVSAAGGARTTGGDVAAVAPRVEAPDGHARYGMLVVGMRYPDAAAGGALLDAAGAAVAMASSVRAPEGDDHGLATPIELVVHVADQLIADGRARHVWLGLHGTDVVADDAEPAGYSGARVDDVVPGGPAARAGVRPGDLVVSLDGTETPSMADLIVALRLHRPGEEVVVGILRAGTRHDVRVELADRDEDLHPS